MTYQLETTKVDTYGTGKTEALDVAGSYSENKHHTEPGTWNVPTSTLKKLTTEAGYPASGYHVADVYVNPSEDQKKNIPTHREDNTSLLNQSGYGGVDLQPENVEQVYVYLERDWHDLWFVTNDNTGITSSSKASIHITVK